MPTALTINAITGESELVEIDAPTPIIPETISMRQARLALLGADLLASVDTAIATMPSPAKDAALIEWEYATEVRRDSQLVAMLGPALGLDDAQIDALFVAASGL